MTGVQVSNDIIHCLAFQTDCFSCVLNGCFFVANDHRNSALCMNFDLLTISADEGAVVYDPFGTSPCPLFATTTATKIDDFDAVSQGTSRSYEIGIILGIIAFLTIVIICLIWVCIIFKRKVTSSVPFV